MSPSKPPEPIAIPPALGDSHPALAPEVVPCVEELVIEDGEPVESIFAEKQYRLLTEPLYVSWKPEGRTFLAVANVGLFYAIKQPPLVPDVMLSLDVPVGKGLTRKEDLSYYTWIIGKPPDVVLEFVSDRRGGEEDYKMEEYAKIGVRYYVVFDRQNRLRHGVLRAFRLRDDDFQAMDPSWLPRVGLGVKLWEGGFEGESATWLRWCDQQGILIPTGGERAEQERQRAERLAAQLRALGHEPNP